MNLLINLLHVLTLFFLWNNLTIKSMYQEEQFSESSLSPCFYCYHNDLPGLIAAIEIHGKNIDETSPHLKKTPLIIATQNNNAVIVEYLLQKNANLDVLDEKNKSALYYAITNGNLSITKLLHKSMTPDACQETFQTVIHRLCKKVESFQVYAPIIKKLISWNAPLITCDTRGMTPFHYLAQYIETPCLLEILKLFLLHKVDVDIKTLDNRTPLMLACRVKNMLTASFLLRKKASVYAINNSEETALFYHVNYLPTIRLLLHHGANINHLDKEGNSILHRLSCLPISPELFIKITSLLFENPNNCININTQNNDGNTALHLIIQKLPLSQPHILLTILLFYNPNCSLKNKSGKTAADCAAQELLLAPEMTEPIAQLLKSYSTKPFFLKQIHIFTKEETKCTTPEEFEKKEILLHTLPPSEYMQTRRLYTQPLGEQFPSDKHFFFNIAKRLEQRERGKRIIPRLYAIETDDEITEENNV